MAYLNVFRCCFSFGRAVDDAEPYEFSRCEPSPPLPNVDSTPAVVEPFARSSREISTASTLDNIPTLLNRSFLKNAELQSFYEGQSFNPLLCSTKIGGAHSKRLTQSLIEIGKPSNIRSLLTEVKYDFNSQISHPKRRMTIASPLPLVASSEKNLSHNKSFIPKFSSFPTISPIMPISYHENKLCSDGSRSKDSHTSTDCGTYILECHNQSVGSKAIMINIPVVSDKSKLNWDELGVNSDHVTDATTYFGNDKINDFSSLLNTHECCSSIVDGRRWRDGSITNTSVDELSDVYILPPPNTPVDANSKEVICAP